MPPAFGAVARFAVTEEAKNTKEASIIIDTYKVDIHRCKHELEDLQAQAQTSGIDYTQCGYDAQLNIYDYNLHNVTKVTC